MELKSLLTKMKNKTVMNAWVLKRIPKAKTCSASFRLCYGIPKSWRRSEIFQPFLLIQGHLSLETRICVHSFAISVMYKFSNFDYIGFVKLSNKLSYLFTDQFLNELTCMVAFATLIEPRQPNAVSYSDL